jgi:hypothetical protein
VDGSESRLKSHSRGESRKGMGEGERRKKEGRNESGRRSGRNQITSAIYCGGKGLRKI